MSVARVTSSPLIRVLLLFLVVIVAPSVARDIHVKGRSYVDLETVATRFGMQAYWLKGYKTFRLNSEWTVIDLDKNSRLARINRLPIYLGFSTLESNGQLYLSHSDYQHTLLPILVPQVYRPAPQLKRIVIDAGHGGRDSGARNDRLGLQEKVLTLDVARRLKKLLERVGYQVVMTRDSDVFIPLERRSQIANQVQGDLFISLHFNAAASTSAAGFESYALTPQYQASTKFEKPAARDNYAYTGNQQDAWNTLVSYHCQRALVQGLGGPDRGIKRARFVVLKGLECPGVLLELGFVSHLETAQKLRGASFRQTLAQSLCDGILAYDKRLQRIR